MNTNTVAKLYGNLSPEERFRLLLAAGLRGDKAEQDRLIRAGHCLTLSVQDHEPFAYAFDELAVLIFVELLALAADYSEAFHLSAEAGDTPEAEDGGDGDAGAEGDANQQTIGERFLDLALSHGYMLKIKGDAWKLFCERMNIPPFAVWESLPGFARLQRALKLAERAAFVPVGMVRWLNRVRPGGEPEVTAVPATPDEAAAALERMFRERVAWWGGQ